MNEASELISKARSLSWISPPGAIVLAIDRRLGSDAKTWMERNCLSIEELTSASLTVAVMTGIFTILTMVIARVFLSGMPLSIMMLVMLLIPPLITISFIQAPSRLAAKEDSEMLVESPSVVGMMSMSMHLSPSLERAVSYASSHSNGTLSKRLRTISWDSMAGWRLDLASGLMEMSSSLSDSNRNLKQSLQMILTATAERSRVGLERLLDKANDLAVQGVREKVDRYVTSLSFPTMVLFAFGVLLPVMLFSLVPMFSMKVILSTGPGIAPVMGFEQVAFLILVIFPICTFIFAQSTLRRHPLRSASMLCSKERGMIVSAMIIAIFAGTVTWFVPFMQPFLTLIAASTAPSAYILLRYRKETNEMRKVPKIEEELTLALFQVGNCMLSGSSLESALLASSRSLRSDSFRTMVSDVMHRVRTEGLTMSQSFASCTVLDKTSSLAKNAYLTVAESSSVDPESTGRTAVNLAKYLSVLRESERKGRERMRSVVDMMSYTSMLFAPIVIGVTGSLYNVVSEITGTEGSSMLTLVGGIYVIELCAIISYFNGGLLGNGRAVTSAYDFAVRVPIAVSCFAITSIIAGQGLSSLF